MQIPKQSKHNDIEMTTKLPSESCWSLVTEQCQEFLPQCGIGMLQCISAENTPHHTSQLTTAVGLLRCTAFRRSVVCIPSGANDRRRGTSPSPLPSPPARHFCLQSGGGGASYLSSDLRQRVISVSDLPSASYLRQISASASYLRQIGRQRVIFAAGPLLVSSPPGRGAAVAGTRRALCIPNADQMDRREVSGISADKGYCAAHVV